nr:nitrate- and nitrite sensing domain-containing protein [Saccharopolyspora sp. HNM0983]
MQWRNWPLPTKLAAVVLVPLIFAITLGVGQIGWQVDQAGEYRRVAQVLDAVERIEPLLGSLQEERNGAVQYLTGDTGPEQVERSAVETDRAVAALDELMSRTDNDFAEVVVDRNGELTRQLQGIQQLRDGVQNDQLAPAQAIQGYSALTNAALSLDAALTSTVADPQLSSNAAASQSVLSMMEEVRLQQALVLTGLSEGALDEQALQQLMGSRARLVSKIGEAGSTVAAKWRELLTEKVGGPEVTQRNQLLAAVLMESTDDVASGEYSIGREQWNTASDASVEVIKGGHDLVADDVRTTAAGLESDASDQAGWDSVLLLAALIAAAATVIVITRHLLGSLRQLRSSALDAAEYQLPDAVAEIRSGGRADSAVTPVPVRTTDEVGQVARAFDEVNQQALRLAVEQADLRRGYSEVFINVSRRSQSLLERQLRLFEDLEHDEEDPDQLSRLFQLDHLATRMRRNNENLMVLSGSDLARRFTQPTTLADVLRAAVSEIEHYPRVVVQPPPNVQLRGYAASDMVRLVAELLDNAANFSAPDTNVTLSGYQAGDGTIVLDVLDQGIGMGDAELARANQRLARVDEDDLASSRRMGLFVAGRLAVRHGIGVELHGGPDVEGVRATVMVPAEHVVSSEATAAWQPPGNPGAFGGNPGSYGNAGSYGNSGSNGDLGSYGNNGHAHQEMPTSGALPSPGRAAPPGWPGASDGTPGGSWYDDHQDPGATNNGIDRNELLHGGATDTHPPVNGSSREDLRTSMWQEPPAPEPPAQPPAPEPPPQAAAPAPEPGLLGNSLFEPSGDVDAERPTAYLFDAPSDLAGHPEPGFEWPSVEQPPPAPGPPNPPSPVPRSRPAPTTPPEPDPQPGRSASQWFQPASENPFADEEGADDPGWPDAGDPADGGASELSYTSSGLPQRTPRSGGAAEPAGEQRAGTRSAGDISRQLADNHNGVRFGGQQEAPAQQAPEAAEPQWPDSGADRGREAAEAAANPQPASFTEAGLPRRTPKAHLVPGSIGSKSDDGSSGGQLHRDADHLRDRLSGFQSGASRGRHRASDEE